MQLATNILVENDEYVIKTYKGRGDFEEGMAQIFETLAANAMTNLIRNKHEYASVPTADISEKAARDARNTELKKIHQQYMTKANEQLRFHEYHILIKGFWHLFIDGDATQADRQFNIVYSKATRADAKGLKKYFSPASIGLGMCSYYNSKYQTALEHFAKAIQANPSCHPSIRVAVASCCFKLGQYDKARAATNIAIDMDPTSADAFCMLALIEQAAAVKDRNNSKSHRLAANEYWRIAIELDPACPFALIHLANFHFHTWKALGLCRFENDIMIKFDKSVAAGIAVGDKLMFDGGDKNFVKDINTVEEGIIVTLAERVSVDKVGESVSVKAKSYNRVLSLANDACKATNIRQVWAESYYIQGRIHQDRGDIDNAASLFSAALQKWESMDLATFALAKIQLSRGEHKDAMLNFEAVAKRNPEDRDTEAYLCLLRALVRNELTTYDKIKDIAAGFEYDIDLWLTQGQLRQKHPEEFGVALKCYLAALDLLKQQRSPSNSMISSVLSNIAMLQMHLGRIQPALESIKSSLIYAQNEPLSANDRSVNPVFNHSEFDKVFYSWSDVPITSVKRGEDQTFLFVDSSASRLNLSKGDEVLIDDVVHVVESVTTAGFTGYSPIDVSALGASRESKLAIFPLRQKMLGHNFNSRTVTLCFNFARILEEVGHPDAAAELYLALLKANPAFIEVYLRMSFICMNAGNFDTALKWICRGLSVDDRNQDALAFKADMHIKLGQFDQAEYICQDLLKVEQKDPRPALVTGNILFCKLKGENDVEGLKQCSKFIHDVLKRDLTNVYAANGIGMLCAEYREFDVASEIFLRAKELSMGFADDINNNLAHTRLIQGRMAEAEQLYQLNMRMMAKSNRTTETGKVSSMLEATANSQFKQKRYEDAVRTLLRGIHHDPCSRKNLLRFWFNIAVVRQEQASSKMNSKTVKKTVRIVQDAMQEYDLARQLFFFLGQQPFAVEEHVDVYNPSVASGHANNADKHYKKCADELQSAEQIEKTAKKVMDERNAYHQERLRKQEEERERVLEVARDAKRETQRLAAEKQKRLETIKAGWTAIPSEKSKDKRNKKPSDSRKEANSEDDNNVRASGTFDSDSDEGLGGGLLSKKADPFADEDSDEDDAIFGKRKFENSEESHSKRLKKHDTGSSGYDNSGDATSQGNHESRAAEQNVDDLFNSDDD